jgi:hypothetical protein
MHPKTRVAVCFSGQLRTGAYAVPNILRFIGDLFPFCDFFMHTWDTNQQKAYNGTSFELYRPTVDDIDRVKKAYSLRSAVVESYDLCIEKMRKDYRILIFDKTNPSYYTNGVSPQWIPQFWSWYQANLLRRDWEIVSGTRYEVVVRMRPDLIFPRYRSLKKEIDHFKKNARRIHGREPIW